MSRVAAPGDSYSISTRKSMSCGPPSTINIDLEFGTLCRRTLSNNKWIEDEVLMTVEHFGSGGRRSDSRLGRRGKKLRESGKVWVGLKTFTGGFKIFYRVD